MKRKKPRPEPLNKCIVTGQEHATDEMIRFVVGPDRKLFPDTAQKLPGKSIWVLCSESHVKKAIKEGLFEKGMEDKLTIPENITETIEKRLKQSCLMTIGLLKKSGKVISGYTKSKKALEKEEAGIIILSGEKNYKGKDDLTSIYPDIEVVNIFSESDIASVLPSNNTVHVILRPGNLLEKLKLEIKRLNNYKKK